MKPKPTATSTTAFTFKEGAFHPMLEVGNFRISGLPWYEKVADNPSWVRITRDTEIEIKMVNAI